MRHRVVGLEAEGHEVKEAPRRRRRRRSHSERRRIAREREAAEQLGPRLRLPWDGDPFWQVYNFIDQYSSL